MASTYYLANVILNWMRGTATTPPSAIYLAALTAVANERTPSFTEVPNTNGYGRALLTLGAPSSGVGQNSNVVVFPAASGSWGSITHLAVLDAGTYGDGNALTIIELEDPVSISAGQQLSFDLTTYRVTVTIT